MGVYCFNTARFLTGEEPVEISANLYSTSGDPRFREVEETVNWMMRFPSGVHAICSTSYGWHENRYYRVMVAIYEAAHTGRMIKLPAVTNLDTYRGSQPSSLPG